MRQPGAICAESAPERLIPGALPRNGYCTVNVIVPTVAVVEPEVPVTVMVYCPAVVPGVPPPPVFPPLPPQPIAPNEAKSTNSPIMASQLRRLLGTPKKNNSASAVPPADGQNIFFIWFSAVVGAVVFTVNVEFCDPPPAVKVTGFGEKLHVGGKLPPTIAVVTAQVRFTVPVNPFSGAITIVAVFPVSTPGVTLSVVVPPLPAVNVGSAVTLSDTDVVSVRLPDIPVMVTVTGLVVTAAESVAVSVTTCVPAAVPAAKPAVTPLGKLEAARATVPEKPPVGVTVMVLVPLPPWAIDTDVGEAESVKLGATTTVRAMVVVAFGVWQEIPQVEGGAPVMVTVTGPPSVAVALAVKVTTCVPDTVPAANPAVTPLGRPLALSTTLPVYPFTSVTVIVLVPLPPSATVTLAGDAESVKL